MPYQIKTNYRIMNIRELISSWKEDCSWVGKAPNLFIKKDVTISHNPCTPNGLIIDLSITDKTLVVDGKLEPFTKSMQFVTIGQGDADRLKSELEQFTNSTIQEREEQIKEWEDKGMRIETSNPLMWKDFK